MQAGDIPKQRGIYSEILTTEDTDNLKVYFSLLDLLNVSWYQRSDHLKTTSFKRTLNRRFQELQVTSARFGSLIQISYLGIKRKAGNELAAVAEKEEKVTAYIDQNGKILGKNYFRDAIVNKGFYSKKREGVADVDPKVRKIII